MYKMIALDMDGTLLNSQKKISKATLEAINKAFNAGKEVVLCTGRCIPELQEYIEQIKDLRYIIGISGALVYDLKEKKEIYINKIPENQVDIIFDAIEGVDVLPQIISEKSLVQKGQMENMEYYGMGAYKSLFEKVATPVDNIAEYSIKNKVDVLKLNLYHAFQEDREKTRKKLEKENFVMVNAEKTSLEISAAGTTKGTGLAKLCDYLGIDLSEVISVGDADNDLDVLSKAGLAVAMGNANDNVKKICDVTVRDCDHNGCGEAIEKYLLSE